MTWGGVKCWGSNYNGQLGIGSTMYATSPADVAGGRSTPLFITLFFCSLKFCSHIPAHYIRILLLFAVVPAAGIWEFTGNLFQVFLAGGDAFAIALGGAHTCEIVSGGGVKCWGANWYGQLGIGSRTDATSPADVAGDGCPPLHLSFCV